MRLKPNRRKLNMNPARKYNVMKKLIVGMTLMMVALAPAAFAGGKECAAANGKSACCAKETKVSFKGLKGAELLVARR